MSKLHASAPSLAVIIPALNEEAAIPSVVNKLREQLRLDQDRILVVDNGSTDATAERALAAGATVVAEPRRGYGRACWAGVMAAEGFDLLLFMDGDGADDASALPRLIEPLVAQKAEIVAGVRISEQREAGSMTQLQVAGNQLVTAMIHLFTGHRVSDVGPLRAIRRAHLLALGMAEMTYGWSTEITIKALRSNYRYQEISVATYARRGGTSKVSGQLLPSLRAGLRLITTVLKYSRWQPTEDVEARLASPD
ncbi:MAG: glycosyltransferase family 2 protein [Candidatus Dormibacteraceae bacterium]